MSGSFISVGANKTYKLTDLKVDTDGEACSGEFVLQTLTNSGRTDKSYYWYYDRNHGIRNGVAGWYDGDGEVQYVDENDVTFTAGQAFWTLGSGFKLVSAGEVLTSTVDVPTSAGGKVQIGNPYPVAVKVNDMVVDTDGENCSGDFVMQTLDVYGRTDKSYYWYYDRRHGKSSGTAGWYDGDGEVAVTDDVVLNPGEGYWVLGSGFTLSFPKLTLNND